MSGVRARLPGISRSAATWALGEIAIVVVSVLIAFALNAWWVERETLRTEQVHLRALVTDFERNIESLRQLIERQARVEVASVDLLKVARSEAGSRAAPAASRVLLWQVFASNRFEPVMGAYTALLNSAGLTLIQDDTLRASLAAFAARVSGRYPERFADELYFSLIREFAGRIGFADEVLVVPGSDESLASLLADARFQEYLALRHIAEGEVAGQYRGFLVLAEQVLADLRGQLR